MVSKLTQPKSQQQMEAHPFKLLNDDGETAYRMVVVPEIGGRYVLCREKKKSRHPVGQAPFPSVDAAIRWAESAHTCGVQFD